MFKKRLEAHNTPKEVVNWRLWYGVFVFGLMGAARGIDEGLIGTSAEQPPFRKLFGLDNGTEREQADLLSNITSMVQMGSILGALIAFVVTDKIGRLWATRQLCILWLLGITIFLASAANGNLGMVYAGRFIAGIGIGQTTVVAPTYLAEISPRTIRGLCVTMFSGAVYLGIMLAYFASWGSNLHISDSTNLQWVIPNLMHVYFAVIIFALSFGSLESPRWLVKVGRHHQAVEALSKLRNLPDDHWFVQAEIMDIQDQLDREREATMGTRWWGALKELLFMKANRYRIMLSIFSQLLGQWSGIVFPILSRSANSITIYAAQYFAMVGVKGQSEKLFSTVVFGIVKFVSSLLCALFLIDFIGRKRSLMSGISLQFVSMLYMAIYLVIFSSVGDSDAPQTSTEKAAGKAAIAAIYLSGFGWALGWNSIQYLINSEIYPLRLRAIGGSFAMTLHFANQYGNTKAVPSMFLSLTPGGTMFFFAAVTVIGFIWVWIFLPELSGKSLEAVDAVFELPWYLIGRKGKDLTVDQGGLQETFGQEKVREGSVDHVESVREVDKRV